jgi:hypothetical protein
MVSAFNNFHSFISVKDWGNIMEMDTGRRRKGGGCIKDTKCEGAVRYVARALEFQAL